MPKTQEQFYKDVQAAIKAVLCDVEQLAAMPPEQACHPTTFDDVRRRIVRRFWSLYKDAAAMQRELV